MKNLKRFIVYFGYSVIIGCLIIFLNLYNASVKHSMVRDFEYKPMFFIIMISLPIFIGFCLALPRFIVKIKKPGAWTFDWVKFIAVGLPSFLANGIPVLYFTLPVIHKYFALNNVLPTTGGIVFGYVLISAFDRVSPSTPNLSEVDGCDLNL